MNTQSKPGLPGLRRSLCGAAIVMPLLWLVPADAMADPNPATATASRVAEVPLNDLNLSTAEGMRNARERLRAAVESVCAEPAKSRGLPRQASFAACVDSTLAAHLKVLHDLRQQHTTVRSAETRAANVSLTDLDLSTPEGARIARERLEAMARRICRELAGRPGQAYEPDYVTCVQDSLARGMAQVDALTAARSTRTARSSAP